MTSVGQMFEVVAQGLTVLLLPTLYGVGATYRKLMELNGDAKVIRQWASSHEDQDRLIHREQGARIDRLEKRLDREPGA